MQFCCLQTAKRIKKKKGFSHVDTRKDNGAVQNVNGPQILLKYNFRWVVF